MENLNSIETNEKTPINVTEWINLEFIQDLISRQCSDGYTVKDFYLASRKGGDYASQMYKLKVVVNTPDDLKETHHFFMKIAPSDPQQKLLLDLMCVFTREIEMYTKILPAFQQYLNINDIDMQFGPKCVKYGNEPIEYLVLEDLSARGYNVASRFKGLDMDHVKMILKKLAYFHAVSACYYEDNGPYDDQFRRGGIYTEKLVEIFDQMMEPNIKQLEKCIEYDWPYSLKQYKSKLLKLGSSVMRNCVKAARPSVDGFNVLNHGDLWVNNIMFKHDNQKNVTDVLLIDLQMGNYGPPTNDLQYFVISSVNTNLKVTKFNEIIKIYHDNLMEALDKLGYQKEFPTLTNLHIDLLQRSEISIAATFGILAMALMPIIDDADLSACQEDDGKAKILRRLLYSNESYVCAMEQLLPFFDSRGLLDS